MNPSFRYQLGDLVDFKARRVTEEYIDETMLTGLIIEQRYVFTADNKSQNDKMGIASERSAISLEIISDSVLE